jgi:hypothetical protein
LRPIRVLEEQLVRTEFAYVAENLLLRGGYRKTHFQADQTTLQAVSQMGRLSNNCETLELAGAGVFTPLLTNDKSKTRAPEIFVFRELFLQAMVRSYLASRGKLEDLLAPQVSVALTPMPSKCSARKPSLKVTLICW